MRAAMAALGLGAFAVPVFWSLEGFSLARWPLCAAALLLALVVARGARVRGSFRRGVLVDAHVVDLRGSRLPYANVVVARYDHEGRTLRVRMLVNSSLDDVREKIGLGSFPLVVDRAHPSRAFPLGLYAS